METIEMFVAEDGKLFRDKAKCEEYEAKRLAFKTLIVSKIGEYSPAELRLGGNHGEAIVDSLPFTAPWMSPLGACLISITNIRRNPDGKVEFQLADKSNVPYDNGTVWRPSEAFYSEWP